MPIATNKSLVREFYAALNSDNWSERIAPFFKYPTTVAAFREQHGRFRSAFANFRFELDDMVAEGDVVAIRGTVSANHVGQFHAGGLKGVPADGRLLTWQEAQFISFAGDEVDSWFIVDGVSRLQQLGVLAEDD